MRFHFDLEFRGAVWPPLPPGQEASAGEAWVGPERFVEWLELWTGTLTPSISLPRRVAETSARLASLSGFFRASYQLEPLETTRRLIEVRDELIVCGWNGATASAGQQPAGPLADWERLDALVVPGLVDRLRALIPRLRDEALALPLRELRLYETLDRFPLRWRELFAVLRERGVVLRQEAPPAVVAEGDLGAWQRASGGARGDGSLQLFRPLTVGRAAVEVAAWLATVAGTKTAVVIGPDEILDRALEELGLPVLGAEPNAGGDPMLALLDGIVALLFEPRDPAEVLAFLLIEPSPVPRGVARALARALLDSPSTRSPMFRAALDASPDDGRATERVRKLFEACVPANGELPRAALEERLARLNRWAQGVIGAAASEPGNLAAVQRLVGAIAALRRVLAASGAESFTRLRFRQLFRLARAEIEAQRPRTARVGFYAVSHPSEIVAPAEVIVWWNFTADERRAPRPLPLSLSERRSLEAVGVELPSRGETAVRQAERMLGALRFASQAVLLCAPRYDARGETTYPHPLWDEIEAVARGLATPAGDQAAVLSLTVDRPLALAGSSLQRELVAEVASPRARRLFRLEGGTLPLRAEESPSSIETLARCPFRYHVRYGLGLRPGLGRALLLGPRLYGKVAHELIAAWFRDRGLVRPQEEAVRQLFGSLGPGLAEALFLRGAEPLGEEIVQRTSGALVAVVEQIEREGASVAGVEEEVAGLLPDQRPIRGRVDLRLLPAAVLDYKWGSAKTHEKALQQGTAVQLACYAWALESAGESEVRVAYFVIGDQRFLSTSAWAGFDALPGPAPAASFERLWGRVEEVRAQLQRGELVATGLSVPRFELEPTSSPASPGVYEPPCVGCEFDALCGRAWALVAQEPEGGER